MTSAGFLVPLEPAHIKINWMVAFSSWVFLTNTHAIQIIAQLPETQADALLILEAARDFVLKFLAEDHLEGAGRPLPGLGREAVVLSLVPAALASATSSASADLSL
jgi:hypothetical protein